MRRGWGGGVLLIRLGWVTGSTGSRTRIRSPSASETRLEPPESLGLLLGCGGEPQPHPKPQTTPKTASGPRTVATDWGTYEVVPDDWVGPLDSSHQVLTESKFDALQTAVDSIDKGTGSLVIDDRLHEVVGSDRNKARNLGGGALPGFKEQVLGDIKEIMQVPEGQDLILRLANADERTTIVQIDDDQPQRGKLDKDGSSAVLFPGTTHVKGGSLRSGPIWVTAQVTLSLPSPTPSCTASFSTLISRCVAWKWTDPT